VSPEAARAAGPGAHRIEFEITQGDGRQRREHSTFLVPR
jgi:hypothetical protein